MYEHAVKLFVLNWYFDCLEPIKKLSWVNCQKFYTHSGHINNLQI